MIIAICIVRFLKFKMKYFMHHFASDSSLSQVWRNMKARCYYEKDKSFKYYGGRGIIVCSQWLNNRKLFILWALKAGWEHGLQIDRIDNNGNYTPDNCQFITHQMNQLNRRKTSNMIILELTNKGLL